MFINQNYLLLFSILFRSFYFQVTVFSTQSDHPVCFGAIVNHKTFLRFIFSQSRLQIRPKYLLEDKTESQNLPNNYFGAIAIHKTFLRFIFSQSRLQIRSKYLLEDKTDSQNLPNNYFEPIAILKTFFRFIWNQS